MLGDLADGVKALLIAALGIVVVCGVLVSCVVMRFSDKPYLDELDEYQRQVEAAEAPDSGTYDVFQSIAFNAPSISTIEVTDKAVRFNLLAPTAEGQQQATTCSGDRPLLEHKFSVDLGDGIRDPTDSFCLNHPAGTPLPFDKGRKAFVDFAEFKLRDSFGFPFKFVYRGWKLPLDFSKLKKRSA